MSLLKPLRRWASWAGIALVVLYLLAIMVLELGEPEPAFDSIPEDAGVASIPAGFLLGAATSAHQVEGGNPPPT